MALSNIIGIHELCKDKLAMINQLQVWNLIPRALSCPKCKGQLDLRQEAARCDGWIWRCPNKVTRSKKKPKMCTHKVSVRTGTFFARSHLPISSILIFTHCWVSNIPFAFIQEQIEISRTTCFAWASFCREVLLTYFLNNQVKLGGPDKVVQIDESMFGKREYHEDHLVDGQWVFGAYERGSGRVCMVTVENRGADSLIPVIQDWILPGTTIISDYWKAYDCLSNVAYQHLKVNRSLFFVDPDSGTHTNSIESAWRTAKAITTASGRKKAHIPGNLARYIFYKKCTELHLNRTQEFFRIAGEVYSACRPQPELCDEAEVEEDVEAL